MVSLEQIGIENFQTYSLKGKLFEKEEDFVVQEIEEDGSILSVEKQENDEEAGEKQDYLVFTLVKRGVSTPEAIKTIARTLHIKVNRIAYNGNKDKRALTSQRISIFKFDPERLHLENERMFFRDVHYEKESCKIGKLYGNHFTVYVKEFDTEGYDIEKIEKEVSKGIPNFYGPQRFGSSSLNIEVSKSILRGDFKSAFYSLALKERTESEQNRDKRNQLRDALKDYFSGGEIDRENIKMILSSLPGFMYFERESIAYLLAHKNDYAGAIRIMPKYIRLMILQAFQYYVFNKTLSRLLKNRDVSEIEKEIDTIGYDLNILDNDTGKIIKDILVQEGIDSLDSLKINSMPEASLKTFKHPSFFIPENFKIENKDQMSKIAFDLRKGSYATILLIKLFGVENVYKQELYS